MEARADERTTEPHLSAGSPSNPAPIRNRPFVVPSCIKGESFISVTILYQGVIGEAPEQGAQKRESETLTDHFPPRLLHSIDKQSGSLAPFLNFLLPPPQLRHFHLCSLGPAEEYEMATQQRGYIRSPWFFESHSKSMSSSHSSPSSEVKVKGN